MPVAERVTFVGRAAELRALGDAFISAGDGRAMVVLVEGLPGIGKTSLVERFLSRLGGAQILRATGDESERFVPFGVVDQLMRVAGERRPGLLAPEGGAYDDHVAVGLRILDLAGQLQDDGPVVIAIDDVQWADEASLRALLFAMRRMVDDAVLLILVVRSGESFALPEGLVRLAGDTTVDPGPLQVEEIRQLAEAAGVTLTARAARRLQEHTSGNPLHAGALLRELPRKAWSDPDDTLPAPRSFSMLVVRQAERATPAARALSYAAAVLGLRSRLADAAVVAELEEPLDALEEAIAAGLLVTDSRRETVSFEHPLVRAALYHDLGPASRARLHRRAAERVTGPAVALRHRVAATSAPNPALADELEAAARDEARRGAGAAAAAMLLDASRLSAEDAERDRRLLEAVDALLYVGRGMEALAYLDRIAGMPVGVRRDMVLAHAAIVAGNTADGQRLLESAWRRCDRTTDPALAAAIARRSAYYWMGELRGEETATWARLAMQLTPGDDPAAVEAAGLLGYGLAMSGTYAEARRTLDRAVERLDRVPGGDGSPVRSLRGVVRFFGGDLEGALADLLVAPAAALRVGSTNVAVAGFACLAEVEYHAGLWEDAMLHADRAVSISVASDEWLPSTSLALAAVSGLAIQRGDLDAAADAVGRLDEHVAASTSEVAFSAVAHARLAAARGEHGSALAVLEPLAQALAGTALREPGMLQWDLLYAEALLDSERYEEANMFLATREGLSASRSHASAIARFARVRGRLEAARGRADVADAAFRLALERGEAVGMPYELALSQLAYGQFLRRRGQRRAAASQLGRARECFVELAAVPALARCDRELAASGLKPVKRTARDPFRLTPRETTVARLAASGMTNRQIATELILSAKTVEVHLTRIYSKLGINARAELAECISAEAPVTSVATL
jgi:DNA-binding CsgD family transcriptional regulator